MMIFHSLAAAFVGHFYSILAVSVPQSIQWKLSFFFSFLAAVAAAIHCVCVCVLWCSMMKSTVGDSSSMIAKQVEGTKRILCGDDERRRRTRNESNEKTTIGCGLYQTIYHPALCVSVSVYVCVCEWTAVAATLLCVFRAKFFFQLKIDRETFVFQHFMQFFIKTDCERFNPQNRLRP